MDMKITKGKLMNRGKPLAFVLALVLLISLIPTDIVLGETVNDEEITVRTSYTDEAGVEQSLPNVPFTLTSTINGENKSYSGTTDQSGECVIIASVSALGTEMTLNVNQGLYDGTWYEANSTTQHASGPTIFDMTLIPIEPASPTITNTNTQVTIPEGSESELQIETNPVNPLPTFSAIRTDGTMPTWFSIDENTGKILMDPPVGQTDVAGSFTVRVTAQNSEGSDTKDFTITVETPSIPEIINTETDISVNEGQSSTLQIKTNGAQPAPTFSAVRTDGTMPSWFKINENTGEITMTPTKGQLEVITSFAIDVTAKNKYGSDKKSFKINIKNKKYVYHSEGGEVTIALDYQLPEGAFILYNLMPDENNVSGLNGKKKINMGDIRILCKGAPIQLSSEAELTFHLDKVYLEKIKKFVVLSGFTAYNSDPRPSKISYSKKEEGLIIQSDVKYYYDSDMYEIKKEYENEKYKITGTVPLDTIKIPKVLHGKSDGTVETLVPTRTGNDITVKVSSLSPFSMVTDIDLASGDKNSDSDDKSTSPRTTDGMPIMLWVVLFLAALAIGAFGVIRKKHLTDGSKN